MFTVCLPCLLFVNHVYCLFTKHVYCLPGSDIVYVCLFTKHVYCLPGSDIVYVCLLTKHVYCLPGSDIVYVCLLTKHVYCLPGSDNVYTYIERCVLFAELNDGEKRTLRSSQDSNLGPLNSGQMLLPTEPLELWHWSRG